MIYQLDGENTNHLSRHAPIQFQIIIRNSMISKFIIENFF